MENKEIENPMSNEVMEVISKLTKTMSKEDYWQLSKQPQVDFEKVIDTWNTIKFIAEEAVDFEGSEAYFDNMDLFFHLLSTKPTFAKVAHEKLKRLNE